MERNINGRNIIESGKIIFFIFRTWFSFQASNTFHYYDGEAKLSYQLFDLAAGSPLFN